MRSILRLTLGLAALTALFLIVEKPQAATGPERTTSRSPAPVATEIDRMIEAKLAEAKLPYSPLADDRSEEHTSELQSQR